ncbi:CHAT domain-containing protein [Nostoc sp. CHAB 5844]|nr:CHAT domain-containing protein [Nostoc sp. CHAB 5844]
MSCQYPSNRLFSKIPLVVLGHYSCLDQLTSVSSPNIPQKQTNQQQKILILTAIPHGLRLDKEIREIEEAIRRAANRDLFEIRIRTAVRPQDIRRAIAEEQPQIVHFCGHGLEDGSLLLEDDGGNNKPVPPEGLASLFNLHADYVRCVLLNVCHSEKTAIAISQSINYAIGMNQPIEDKAAIAFAQGFYDGLGYKNSGNQDLFQRAFDEGMVAIKMENQPQENGSISLFEVAQTDNKALR